MLRSRVQSSRGGVSSEVGRSKENVKRSETQGLGHDGSEGERTSPPIKAVVTCACESLCGSDSNMCSVE